jgi:hypothetical protein
MRYKGVQDVYEEPESSASANSATWAIRKTNTVIMAEPGLERQAVLAAAPDNSFTNV